MAINNILIAENQDIALDNLIRISKNIFKEAVIHSANSADKAIDILKNSREIDFLITDLFISKRSDSSTDCNLFEGFRVLKSAKAYFPNIRTLVFTHHYEREIVKRLLSNNVHGILQKSSTIDVLIKGIETVGRGENFECETIHGVAVDFLRTDNEKSLSERHIEILKLLGNGLIYKEISEVLCIHHRTVEEHKSKMSKMLKAKTTVELYRKAILQGYINPFEDY